MLRILTYIAKGFSPGRRLEKAIRGGAWEGKVEIYEDLDRFTLELNKPVSGGIIIVMGISDRVELIRTACFREMITEPTLILILPDDGAETISLAHRLRPRFLCFADEDFAGVAAVLARLIARTRLNKSISY
jgi:hypothetical protein